MTLRVLIAEDEEDIAQQYKMTLEALGHEVVLTKDGESCLKLYHKEFAENHRPQQNPFDVVLIDYMMPLKDGIFVAKEIQKECPEQRIIFVTGHGPKLLSELNDFEGKVDVMVKPIPLTALIAKIENRRQKEIAKKLYYNLKKWDGA